LGDELHIVHCPQCSGKIRTPRLTESRQVKCGHCQHVFRLAPADVIIDTIPGLAQMSASDTELSTCPECTGKIRIPRVKARTVVPCGHCGRSLVLGETRTPVSVETPSDTHAPSPATGEIEDPSQPRARRTTMLTSLLLAGAGFALVFSTAPRLRGIESLSQALDLAFSMKVAPLMLVVAVGIILPGLILKWVLGLLFSHARPRLRGMVRGLIIGAPLGVLASPMTALMVRDTDWHADLSKSVLAQVNGIDAAVQPPRSAPSSSTRAPAAVKAPASAAATRPPAPKPVATLDCASAFEIAAQAHVQRWQQSSEFVREDLVRAGSPALNDFLENRRECQRNLVCERGQSVTWVLNFTRSGASSTHASVEAVLEANRVFTSRVDAMSGMKNCR